jgi:hypothetical protein
MRTTTTKKWWVGWARLGTLKLEITTTTKLMTMTKTTTFENLGDEDFSLIDGKVVSKMTMMNLDFEDLELVLPHR